MNILGKKYDEFLKSPESVKGVANVIHKYVEFKRQLNNVMEIWGAWLSIPTKRDMDDVCKELYQLKKQTREQDTLVQEQRQSIEDLKQKLREREQDTLVQEQGKSIEDLQQKIQALEASIRTITEKKETPAKRTPRKTTSRRSSSARGKTTKTAKDAE